MKNSKLVFVSLILLLTLYSLSFAKESNYKIPLASKSSSVSDETESILNLQKGLRTIAKKSSPAVLFISVSKVIEVPHQLFNPLEELFGFPSPRGRGNRGKKGFKQKGAGSGFIIDKKRGYILTNNHVVGDASEIVVIDHKKRKFDAKVVGTDKHTDVAVIQVKNLPPDLNELNLADSQNLNVGDFAIAIGAPYELPQTFTFGVISAKGRRSLNITDYGDFIQTDAAINPGNSGGPLIDIYGNVIGMNTFIISQTGGSVGLGFAIPSHILKSVGERLINKGSIKRAKLGVYIQDLDENLAQEFGLKTPKGSLIAQVESNTPASKAGLKEGDIIIDVNGNEIKDSADLRLKIGMSPIDQKTSIKILRKGKERTFKILLAEQESSTKVARNKGKFNSWGLKLKRNSKTYKNRYGLTTTKGVVITDVEPNSISAKAGIMEGDVILSVNRKNINSPAGFKKHNRSNKILLRILRKNFYQYLRLSK